MHKRLIFNLAFILITHLLISQSNKHCFQDEVLRIAFKNNPALKDEYNKNELLARKSDSLAAKIHYQNVTATASPIYTIPVVFHILHMNGPENISDAQIYDALNILNRDYRKLNPDTASIIAPFSAADARFEFRLATKDTNGNCTTGIVRHFDPHTLWATGTQTAYTQYKYTWSTNTIKYLNVYVVESIPGAAGYSSFPGMNPAFADVIVIENAYFGSIGTGDVIRSRDLTHEVGHFFNLQHVWGSGPVATNCGDDGVADTPITKGFNSCPSSSPAICNPPTVENFQNYMDYSYCSKMFTAGQVNRMWTAVNSTVSSRSTLWSNSNLISTGVINPVSPCQLIPGAYAASNIYTVCLGQPIAFFDGTFNGTVTAWTWSATGSPTITSPSSSSTTISFGAVGIQSVHLTVANNFGPATITKTVLVNNSQVNVSVNYSESFENPGLPTNFNIINPDNDVTWTQTSLAAATGSNSYYIDGSADAPASFPDILETPSYDFSVDSSASFTFKYAYAKKDNSNTDVFKVQASSDCGATWVNIYQPSNSTMASLSGGVSNISFTPTPNQFATYTLSAHPNFVPFLGLPWVKIRFSFTEDSLSGYGNNIYLDDINFNSYRTAGLETISKMFGCTLYPNPSSGTSALKLELSDPSEVIYTVSNTVGELLFTGTKTLESGKHNIVINEDGKLKPGLYFVNININKQHLIKKLIITNK